MDVRIGVIYSARDIDLQLDDETDRDALRKQVDEVLADDERVLWLTDKWGREVGVPSKKLAYVEIGSSAGGRQIGFSS